MGRRKSKKNEYSFILILIITILIIISLTSFIYSKYKVVQVNYIPIDFEIGNVIGLTIDTDALHFGRIPKGSGAIRQINLTNNFDYPVKFNLKYSSDSMNWVVIGENGFVLEPNENKFVNIAVNTPQNAQEKSYNATLKIIMLRN